MQSLCRTKWMVAAKRKNLMAKGMSKPGKNVKKPKKEKAKPAVLTASTKGAVVINGGKSKE